MLKETNLQIVASQKFMEKELNIYGTIKSPLFLAKDVANWIDIKNVSQMISSADLDEDEKGIYSIDTLGGLQKLLFLTEDGLYDVLMTSSKRVAKQYKRKIKQTLKQIRQTGGYIEKDREREFIENYFPSFTDNTKLAMVQDLKKKNEEYKIQISQLTPQAEAYQDLMTAEGYINFIDLAQSIQIGRTKLFDFLRKHKVLTKQSKFNVPYRRFVKNGCFKVVHSKDNNNHYKMVTMVSPKGIDYVYKLVKKNNLENEFKMDNLVSATISKRTVA